MRAPSSLDWIIAAALVVALSAFLLYAFWWLPGNLVQQRLRNLRSSAGHVGTAERLTTENEVRASAVQAVSGLLLTLGVLATFWQLSSTQQATARQLQLAAASQQGDRFADAVGQLGKKDNVAQAGGLHTLGRIALDAKMQDAASATADREAVAGVLNAYVRNHLPLPSAGGREPPSATVQPLRMRDANAQAAIDILVRQYPTESDDEGPESLAVDLPSTNLAGVALNGAILPGADLQGASLTGADLRGRILVGPRCAKLICASRYSTSLRSCRLPTSPGRILRTRGAWMRPLRTELLHHSGGPLGTRALGGRPA